jgi:hypothetical protein
LCISAVGLAAVGRVQAVGGQQVQVNLAQGEQPRRAGCVQRRRRQQPVDDVQRVAQLRRRQHPGEDAQP